MITAHLPSGIVLARALGPRTRVIGAAAIAGAVFPDLDMIWFYLVDDRAFHHHRYWVHIPAFWAVLALVTLPLLALVARRWIAPALAFLAGIFLHLCLDTIAGSILWAWPFSDRFYQLVTIRPRYGHWVLNFILHPVFLLELLIWAAALTILVQRRKGME